MPRVGWVKPSSDERLSDHISIGVLTRTFPPDLIDRVVAEAGRGEKRQRLLPARVVVYYVLAMALFSQASYEEVMRHLVEGLSWADGWKGRWSVPTKAAIFKARTRLGPEPMERLFAAVATPLGSEQIPGCFYRDLRLMSIDGTTLDLADTTANSEAFGRPGSGRGERVGAYPQLRLVGLGECGTHAIVEAAMSPLARGEQALCDQIIPSLEPGQLLLADRAIYSFARWRAAKERGAELCWRAKSNQVLPAEDALPDGSYLSSIYDSADKKRHDGVAVRVIEYTLEDPTRPAEPRYRLLTTILDPDRAPAAELAGLYAERWEFENTLDELKTHQRGPRLVLRSKSPEGVYQEAWGYLLVHYAIRRLMHEAALAAKLDPDRLSFTRTLRVARRTTHSQPGFSP